MKKWLRRLFCRHDYGDFVCTKYEGFPPDIDGYYECRKCGDRTRWIIKG